MTQNVTLNSILVQKARCAGLINKELTTTKVSTSLYNHVLWDSGRSEGCSLNGKTAQKPFIGNRRQKYF